MSSLNMLKKNYFILQHNIDVFKTNLIKIMKPATTINNLIYNQVKFIKLKLTA